MLTDVLETTNSFDEGRRLSSGRAEAKSQSSSAATPFVLLAGCCFDCGVGDEKSKSEEDAVVEGAEAWGGRFVCCWFVVEEKEAKGSEGGWGD